MMKSESLGQRILDRMEKLCNKIPPPGILFLYLFLLLAVLSFVLSAMNVQIVEETGNTVIRVNNFLSADGLYWFLRNMITNFTSFAPLGLVLLMTIAVGFCEDSGLFQAFLNSNFRGIRPSLLPYAVVFIGVIGNIASDTCIIVIPPLAGLLYLKAGKHPAAGMVTGFLAAEAGFSANLMISGTDALLQAFTQDAADSLFGAGNLVIDVTCNWYFLAVSTFLCVLVIGFLSQKFVEPRFGSYTHPKEEIKEEEVSSDVRKGLRAAGIALVIFIALIVLLYWFGPLGIVEGQEALGVRAFTGSYLLRYLIVIMMFFFTVPGIAYGISIGKYQNVKDVYTVMINGVKGMSGYIVFCFFCAQFQKLFSWTNIDRLISVAGTRFLTGIHLSGFAMVVAVILMSGFVNLFITSGSAKWAIMAPVFVPMLYMLGNYHPAFTQLIYRIGDSPTNCITPMNAYLWIILESEQKLYDPDVGIGTLISATLPVALGLLAAWILMLGVWVLLKLPIGPATGIYLPVMP